MNIFHSLLALTADASPDEQVAAAVSDVATQHRLNGVAAQGWSLCELCPDAEDYTYLYALLATIPYGQARAFLDDKADWQFDMTFGGHRLTLRGGMGILLLLLCVEAARRDAHEGALWPHASRAFETTEWSEMLFVGGQPNELFKQTIYTAAREWNLRHLFDHKDANEPMQWYFQTVKMQYGISGVVGRCDAFAKHLQWGGSSDAVRALLATSKGFASFFRVMQGVRGGRIDQTEMQLRLRQYPAWVPANCTLEQLFKSARLRVAGAVAAPAVGTEAAALSLVSAAKIEWCGTAQESPLLWLKLEPAFLDELLESSARLVVSGKTVADLSRQSNSSLLPLPRGDFGGSSPYTLHIPFTDGAAEITLAVITSGKEEIANNVVHAETINLRNAYEEVSSCDGQEARFVPGVAALCWLSEGLELRCGMAAEAISTWQFANGTMLCRLPQGWHGSLSAVFPEWEAEPLWENPAARSLITFGQTPLPEWAQGCEAKLQVHPTNLAHVGVWVALAPQVTVRRVRLGGRSFTGEAQNGVWGGVCVATLADAIPVDIWLAHESGVTHRWRRFCTVPGEGIFARCGTDDWKLCDAQKTVSVRSVSGNLWRVFAPRTWWSGNVMPLKAHLFEGDRLLGAVATGRARGAIHFEPPSGWGMQVQVRSHRFNNIDAPLVFAKGVFDYGILGKPERSNERLTMPLVKRLVPSEAVQVHLWDIDGNETRFGQEAITVLGDNDWEIEADPDTTCLVVAISHNGYRIGARHLPGFVEALRGGWGGIANASYLAATLRWLKLPLLSESWRNAAQRWRDAAGWAAVSAWIQNTDLPQHLMHTAEDGWDGARRALLCDWEPSSMQAGQLINRLAPKRTEAQIGMAFAFLLEISPQMAVAIWRATRWNAALPDAPTAQGVREALLAALSKRFEQAVNEQSAAQALLDAAGRRLGGEYPLADTFLTQLLSAKSGTVAAQNRDCALESCAELRAVLFLRGIA